MDNLYCTSLKHQYWGLFKATRLTPVMVVDDDDGVCVCVWQRRNVLVVQTYARPYKHVPPLRHSIQNAALGRSKEKRRKFRAKRGKAILWQCVEGVKARVGCEPSRHAVALAPKHLLAPVVKMQLSASFCYWLTVANSMFFPQPFRWQWELERKRTNSDSLCARKLSPYIPIS